MTQTTCAVLLQTIEGPVAVVTLELSTNLIFIREISLPDFYISAFASNGTDSSYIYGTYPTDISYPPSGVVRIPSNDNDPLEIETTANNEDDSNIIVVSGNYVYFAGHSLQHTIGVIQIDWSSSPRTGVWKGISPTLHQIEFESSSKSRELPPIPKGNLWTTRALDFKKLIGMKIDDGIIVECDLPSLANFTAFQPALNSFNPKTREYVLALTEYNMIAFINIDTCQPRLLNLSSPLPNVYNYRLFLDWSNSLAYASTCQFPYSNYTIYQIDLNTGKVLQSRDTLMQSNWVYMTSFDVETRRFYSSYYCPQYQTSFNCSFIMYDWDLDKTTYLNIPFVGYIGTRCPLIPTGGQHFLTFDLSNDPNCMSGIYSWNFTGSVPRVRNLVQGCYTMFNNWELFVCMEASTGNGTVSGMYPNRNENKFPGYLNVIDQVTGVIIDVVTTNFGYFNQPMVYVPPKTVGLK